MTLRRERWRVEGRVQGVGFRARVARLARHLELTGAVWNEGDGSVTVEVEGTEELLSALAEQLLVPDGEIRPERVERLERLPPQGRSDRFEVRA